MKKRDGSFQGVEVAFLELFDSFAHKVYRIFRV